MIRIRKAIIEDEAKVIDLLRTYLSPIDSTIDWQMAAIIFQEIVKNDEKGTTLVAEQEGDLVGVLTLSYPVAIRCGGIYSSIEGFIVSERVQGKGVGGQLLEAAIAEATAKGCYEIQANRSSEVGYPLYLRHGLKDSGSHLMMKLPHQAMN